ncbi:uncharacterized protein LOC106656349 [Trichogramma pretiosum]|uniref:uncharacterized protein LOC106656349 n=1 Tax=Trichogramma pretiosum TaxID=7493 RepID=UPI000C71A97A|nr:uncharacterized protein LOC106656349 [Trichogramma pretiosum]
MDEQLMAVVDLVNKKKRQRRWWSKPHIRHNYLTGYGGYQLLFHQFKLKDEEAFINVTRMDVHTFNYTYDLIKPSLIITSFRPSLPPQLQFSMTLHYLAYAVSLNTLANMFNIGYSTVAECIPEVCSVICLKLGPLFMRFPTKNEFQAIAIAFYLDLDISNCVGALDGRHCPISKPPNSGSLFYNYKKFFSIVNMAICDSKKRFIWANIGYYGSMNDAGVLANSDLGIALCENEIELPPPLSLPGTETRCPHYFIGDGIFPLKNYLMKPFMRNENLTIPQRIYNFRISHARRIIECAFGQLTQQWKIHEKALQWELESTEKIIMSTLILNNLLLDMKYNCVGNRWNNCPIEVGNNIQGGNVFQEFAVRNSLMNYFVSPAGAVHYQWEKI